MLWVKLLLCADDMKICAIINLSDCMAFQSLLLEMYKLYIENHLFLKVAKCSTVSFSSKTWWWHNWAQLWTLIPRSTSKCLLLFTRKTEQIHPSERWVSFSDILVMFALILSYKSFVEYKIEHWELIRFSNYAVHINALRDSSNFFWNTSYLKKIVFIPLWGKIFTKITEAVHFLIVWINNCQLLKVLAML